MIRYFSYIDEQTIDSFYNQLENTYDVKRKSINRSNLFTGEVKISLKNIILGFLDGEGQVIDEFSKNINEEIERSIKIESKIMELIKIAKGDEESEIYIDNLQNHIPQLVCGIVQVIEHNDFLEKISKVYNVNIHKYEDFLRVLEYNECRKWDDIKEKLIAEITFGNGLQITDVMDNWYKEEKFFSFIVINSIYPIIMDMSYKKITMPHSSFRSSGLFCSLTKFNVMGILTKFNNGVHLKPLALWSIVNEDNIQGFIKNRK